MHYRLRRKSDILRELFEFQPRLGKELGCP
jgi:hypothetical protein